MENVSDRSVYNTVLMQWTLCNLTDTWRQFFVRVNSVLDYKG